MQKRAPTTEAGAAAPSRRDERRERADQRQQQAPLRKEIQRIEKRLATLESERAEIERLLASAEIYDGQQGARIAELVARRGVVGAEIGTLEDAWLDAQDALTRSD